MICSSSFNIYLITKDSMIKIDTFYTYKLQQHGTLHSSIKPRTSKEAQWAEGICRYFVLGNWSPTHLFMSKRVRSKYVLGLLVGTLTALGV